METVVGQHFVHVRHQDLRKYQVCVLCSCCRPKTRAMGPKGPSCPRKFQELAEPEPLEAEAAPASLQVCDTSCETKNGPVPAVAM